MVQDNWVNFTTERNQETGKLGEGTRTYKTFNNAPVAELVDARD